VGLEIRVKINPNVKTLAPSAAAEERSRVQKQAEQPKAQSSGSSVKLSSLSSQLREIEAGMDKTQSVDSKKVAEIKKAIDQGRFEVNSSVVADRLLENTRDFLRTHKQ
jgi:negative regulator of flagellin synthesis FlgM